MEKKTRHMHLRHVLHLDIIKKFPELKIFGQASDLYVEWTKKLETYLKQKGIPISYRQYLFRCEKTCIPYVQISYAYNPILREDGTQKPIPMLTRKTVSEYITENFPTLGTEERDFTLSVRFSAVLSHILRHNYQDYASVSTYTQSNFKLGLHIPFARIPEHKTEGPVIKRLDLLAYLKDNFPNEKVLREGRNLILKYNPSVYATLWHRYENYDRILSYCHSKEHGMVIMIPGANIG